MDIVVITIVMAAVSLLSWTVLSVLFAEDKVVRTRLRDLNEYELSQVAEVRPVLQPFTKRTMVPLARRIASAFTSLSPHGWDVRTRTRLAVAGTPANLRPDTYALLKLATAAVAGSLALLVLGLGLFEWRFGLLLVPAGLVVGFLAPDYWLGGRESARKSAIRRELADMLDMLTISVEAGLGFDAALSKYVKNSRGALSEEFGRVLQEVQSGASRRDALKRMSDRTQVTELRSFITAIIQAEVLGTSIADVLRTQSHEIRLRRRQHAEEKAQKMPVKMVFPVILCILPATMIVILGPAIMRLAVLFGM